jgi:uncharacterized protein
MSKESHEAHPAHWVHRPGRRRSDPQLELEAVTIDAIEAHGPTTAVPRPGRNVELAEIAVFLFLIVPSMILSLFAVRQGQLGFALVAAASIFRDAALVALILYFLWRNGEPITRIGWSWRRPVREVLVGIACFIPVYVGAELVEGALLLLGFSAPKTPLPSFLKEQGSAESILAVVLVVVVAIAEETIFRGYLLLRFRDLLGSMTGAVLLSSTIFAAGHGYEGSAGLVTVGLMGAAFAVVYLWRKSLVAPITMHFLQDLLSIVLLPLLTRK